MYFDFLYISIGILSLFLCVNFFSFKMLKKTSNVLLSENVKSICQFIIDGTSKIIVSINKTSLVFLAIIVLILSIQMFAIKFLFFPVFLLLSGFLTSLCISRFGCRLLQQQGPYFFSKLDMSKNDLFRFILLKGRIVLVVVLSLVVIDFIVHFMILDFVYHHNILQFQSVLNDVFLSNALAHSSEIAFLEKIHQFKIHILILLFFHFLGYVTQSIISVLYSSYFGSVSDVTVDITSFLNYDFYEDDIRNPAILADFVGDFLKKSFKILNLISCFTVGLLLVVSYFVSYSYLENAVTISDDIFNHIISSIIVFTIGISVYYLSSFYMPKYISSFKDIVVFSVKRFFIALFLVVLVVGSLFYFEPTLDLENLIFIFLGMSMQLVFYGVILYYYRLPNEKLSSIFSYIVFGVFRGASLFFILIFVWLIFLSFIFYFKGVDNVRYNILNLNYFLVGFLIQLFFCLGDYLGLNFIDSSAGIRKILNFDKSKDDSVLMFQKYRSKLEILIKNSLCFMGIMFVLSIMFFYYQRLLIYLHLANNSLHLDSNLISLKLSNLNQYYQIGIGNLSFDIGLLLGVFIAVGILVVLIYGFYTLYQQLSNKINDQMKSFDLIQSGKKMPDYLSIIANLNLHIKKFISIALVVVLVMPYFVTKLFGVAGVIGTMFSLFFILFIIAGLSINIGTYWSYTKIGALIDDQIEENAVIKTNLIFCDTLGDLLKDLLGVSLIVIMVGILCYFILFIPTMFNIA